jgi:hypothetical protein
MAYIGKTPVIGNFQVCDAISVVDAQAAYTMQVGGVNVSPESANHMLVSLNGILQAPTSSFTVSGSTITFASALETGDVIDFIQILGNVLDLGVPSDNTVTTAKIVDGAVTSAKLASGTGGKILQVVTDEVSGEVSTTSTSYTDITGLSVTITPSSTSSKIYVIANLCSCRSTSTNHVECNSFYNIVRNSTELTASRLSYGASNANANRQVSGTITLTNLDEPNTTSATTYKCQFKAKAGDGQTARINESTDNTPVSSITVMEISA